MANDIYDSIRAALETKLVSTLGAVPIAYENVAFEPTTGTLFVKPVFIPTTTQPATRGSSPQLLYQGVFNVTVYAPEGNGPSQADNSCNTITNAFAATTDISFVVGSDTYIVHVRYAERQQGRIDTPWYTVPVNIGWYIYNT